MIPSPPVSIAPMMDRTDRHYRYMMRLITKRTLLYTEMITCKAILHGDRNRLLGFDSKEKPLSLQLGGDNPKELATCAKIAEEYGYDEVNINIGCPSPRVQSGNFGVCLMTQPDLVAHGVNAMRAACNLPVTVKHRIGVDDLDKYEDMANFVEVVSGAGPSRFTVHARKAWLQGLSPKENRNVPPLRYEDVYRLKRDFPELQIEINGGIKTISQMQEHLRHTDAVMLGRAAYDNPWLFSQVDAVFFNDDSILPFRHLVVREMIPYIEQKMAEGHSMMSITRHMLQLFAFCPGAKHWRQTVGTASTKKSTNLQAIKDLLTDTRFQTL